MDFGRSVEGEALLVSDDGDHGHVFAHRATRGLESTGDRSDRELAVFSTVQIRLVSSQCISALLNVLTVMQIKSVLTSRDQINSEA